MPFFTLQVSPEGPILSLDIGVSRAHRDALVAVGQSIKTPRLVRGLVDTGASNTCVDPVVLKALGLSPTGIASVDTPSTGGQPHNADQYDIGLVIPGSAPTSAPLVVENLPVICADLETRQGFQVLIGRDVLSLCLLEYNGPTGLFTIAY